MEKVSLTLIVLFESPFWVGIFECRQCDKLEVAKIVFGKEPKLNEIYEFVLTQYNRITFSSIVQIESVNKKKMNPKRMQRLAKKQASEVGIGTKSQQALKVQQEERKEISKQKKREKRAIEKQKQFALKQKKRYEKHRGH